MGVGRLHAMLRISVAIGLAATLAGAGASPAAAAVTLEEVAGGFTRPLYITHAGDARLFVVEQGGLIKIIDPDGSVRPEPFLDVSARVATSSSEQGLLGLAFHPAYATNGLFYINTRVSRTGPPWWPSTAARLLISTRPIRRRSMPGACC